MREPYIPLFTSVVRSSLWSLEAETIKVFLTICAEADPEGFCSASVDGIRRLADLSLDRTRECITVLATPDECSKDLARGGDGRRIEIVPGGYRVVNLPWYRELARKEAERARKREWWNKKGAAARRAARPTETETETETKAPLRERDPDRARTNATHVFVVPDGDPPKPYLDAAVMAGVTAERAAETWVYWRDAGLPAGGVRNLYGWLVGKAKRRGNAPPEAKRGPAKGMFGQAPRQPDAGKTGFENVEEFK